MLKLENIDNGIEFDWGKTSDDYARYRDIYPNSYFDALHSLGFAKNSQSILDVGTGTGVIARKVYSPNLSITGIDIEENQILKAKQIAENEGKEIEFITSPAEKTKFEPDSFDYIIAAQCYIYFDLPRLMSEINRILKPNGKLIISWFCWLPFESQIAQASEELILKYNPDWKGAGFKSDYEIKFDVEPYDFILENQIRYSEQIPFTLDSWAGRIRATRGVGAYLNERELNIFNDDHMKLLAGFHVEEISIPHLVIINSYKRIDE